jgi:hypothetical protein
MIEFDIKTSTSIPPEGDRSPVIKYEDISFYFENLFKRDIEEFLIYKKNNFKNPNKELLFDFLNKFENFIKTENGENDNHIIHLVFENIKNCFKIIENKELIPNNKKMMPFFVSFIISKFSA